MFESPCRFEQGDQGGQVEKAVGGWRGSGAFFHFFNLLYLFDLFVKKQISAPTEPWQLLASCLGLCSCGYS